MRRFFSSVAGFAFLAAALLIGPPAGAQAPAPAGRDVLSSESASPPAGGDTLTTLPEKKAPRPPAAAPPRTVPAASGGTIALLNGNGVRRFAAAWAGRLRARGLRVGRVGNARRMDHAGTIIYYRKGAEGLALRVRRALGRRGRLVPGRKAGPHAVVVILGKDMAAP